MQAALYCLEDDEGPLLRYLANARDLLGRPLYDPQTVLRLARQRNKLHACVELLCDLNLYEVRSGSHCDCCCIQLPIEAEPASILPCPAPDVPLQGAYALTSQDALCHAPAIDLSCAGAKTSYVTQTKQPGFFWQLSAASRAAGIKWARVSH